MLGRTYQLSFYISGGSFQGTYFSKEACFRWTTSLGPNMIWAEHHFGQNMTFFWGEIFGGLFERESDLLLGTVPSGAALQGLPGRLPSRYRPNFPWIFFWDFQKTRSRTTKHRLTPGIKLRSKAGEVKFSFFLSSNWWKVEVDWNTVFFFLIVGVGSVQAPLFGCKGFEHLDLSKTSHAKGFGLGGLLGFSGLHGLLVESPSQLSPMCCFFFRGTRHRQFYRFLVNMAFSRAGGKKSGLHRSQSKIVGFNIGEKIISAWENWEFSSHTNFTWKEPGCRPWLVNKKKKTRRVGRIYIYMYLDTYIRTHRCIRTSTIINWLVCLKTRRNLVALSYFFWDRWITTQRNISTKSGEGVFLFENIQASESLRVGIFLIDVPFFGSKI